MSYAFIREHVADFPIQVMCEVLDVSRSGYYAWVSRLEEGRPRLVVGFAAETHEVVAHATAKRQRKGCDWIVANDVSPETGIMGGAENAVTLITADAAEAWPRLPKDEVARRLALRIAEALRGAG